MRTCDGIAVIRGVTWRKKPLLIVQNQPARPLVRPPAEAGAGRARQKKERIMADARKVQRPLSPFMIGPYYRPQLTSISSITIRITGIATIGTVFLLVCWLLAAASSAEAFAIMDGLLTSILGDVLLTLATWAIWYHVLGRLRHLVWDMGYLLDIPASETMAKGMFIGATLLTLITVFVV